MSSSSSDSVALQEFLELRSNASQLRESPYGTHAIGRDWAAFNVTDFRAKISDNGLDGAHVAVARHAGTTITAAEAFRQLGVGDADTKYFVDKARIEVGLSGHEAHNRAFLRHFIQPDGHGIGTFVFCEMSEIDAVAFDHMVDHELVADHTRRRPDLLGIGTRCQERSIVLMHSDRMRRNFAVPAIETEGNGRVADELVKAAGVLSAALESSMYRPHHFDIGSAIANRPVGFAVSRDLTPTILSVRQVLRSEHLDARMSDRLNSGVELVVPASNAELLKLRVETLAQDPSFAVVRTRLVLGANNHKITSTAELCVAKVDLITMALTAKALGLQEGATSLLRKLDA